MKTLELKEAKAKFSSIMEDVLSEPESTSPPLPKRKVHSPTPETRKSIKPSKSESKFGWQKT